MMQRRFLRFTFYVLCFTHEHPHRLPAQYIPARGARRRRDFAGSMDRGRSLELVTPSVRSLVFHAQRGRGADPSRLLEIVRGAHPCDAFQRRRRAGPWPGIVLRSRRAAPAVCGHAPTGRRGAAAYALRGAEDTTRGRGTIRPFAQAPAAGTPTPDRPGDITQRGGAARYPECVGSA